MQNIVRRAILAIALIAGIAPAIAQAPPPIPGLPDTERRTAYSISASTCACAVNFALYGDSTDYQNWVEVFINGVEASYNDSNFGWTITSPTGPLANIPRPVTDAVLTFAKPQTGVIQIVGARRPRRVSQFSESAGVSARNINQVVTDIVAMLREVWDKINDVTGRVVRAPPGETMSTLPPAANRASMGACFDSGGNLAPCVGTPSGSFAPGSGVTFTGTNPTTISTPTFAAGTGIAFTGSNPTVISAGATGGNGALLAPSRAAAAAIDLHTFGTVTTLGYAVPGDGGGATFKNVGTAAFIDTYIDAVTTPPTLVGGTGYGNATYTHVFLTGGHAAWCPVTIVVSGGAVTSVTQGIPCVGYAVGDVLTTANTNLGGSGSGFTYTVNAVIGPVGSFSDSVGTHFQYVVDQGNYINTKQFGSVNNWNNAAGDAAATNDQVAVQSAIAFASYNPTGQEAPNGGWQGGRVVLPKGLSLICGQAVSSFAALVIPEGVQVSGLSPGASGLKECTAQATGSQFISLCNPLAALGEYGCEVDHMQILSSVVNAASGTAAIYSAAGQQFPLVDNVEFVISSRGCIKYEFGRGGAANAIFQNVDCEQGGFSGTPTNNGISLNAPGTQETVINSVYGCPTAGCVTAAPSFINVTAGDFIGYNLNIEGAQNGITLNVPSGSSHSIKNVTATANAGTSNTAVIQMLSTNALNKTLIENIQPGNVPITVLNSQAGHTANTVGDIIKQCTVGTGACS